MELHHVENTHQRKLLCASLDVRMLPSKLTLFVCHASVGIIVPYINLFLLSIGLTTSEVGFIIGITFVTAFLAPPFWGMLSDFTGNKKLIFVIIILGYNVSIFSLPWVADEIKSNCTKDYLKSNSSNMVNQSFQYTSNASSPNPICAECRAKYLDDIQNITAINKECSSDIIPFSNTLFYCMLVLLFVTKSFLIPLGSILDSIVLDIIKFTKTHASYGEQRMFGSIGAGIGSFISGVAVDNFHHPTMSIYTAAFFLFLPFSFLLTPLILVLYKQTSWQQKEVELGLPNNTNNEVNVSVETEKKPKLQILLKIFRSLDNIFMMICCLLAGILKNIIVSFLFMIMKDEMNSSKTAMGIVYLVGSLAEIFIYPFSQRLIAMFGGTVVCLEIGIFTRCIILLVISYIKNPWMVLLPQVFFGASKSLFHAAKLEYTVGISSEEVYITTFAIITSLEWGVAGLVANMAGGVMYNDYNGPVLFRYTAMLGFAWLIVCFIYFHGISLFGKCCMNTNIITPEDSS